MTDHLVQVPRPEIGRQVWDAFVETTEEAWLWHRYDLIEALLTWPGRSDLSFGIVDGSRGERVVAVVPLNLVLQHCKRRRFVHFRDWISWGITDTDPVAIEVLEILLIGELTSIRILDSRQPLGPQHASEY